MKRIKGLLALLTLYLLVACCQNTKVDDNLYRIMVGDKYGFMDASGKIVIEPQFDNANESFSEGVCFVELGERKGLIDRTGLIIRDLSDTIGVCGFENGLSVVWGQEGRLCGVIDKNVRQVVPIQYDDIEIVKENDGIFITAEKNNRYFIMDQKGNVLHEGDGRIGSFTNGLCRISINEKCGYIDLKGQLVIDTIYDDADDFTEDGVAWVYKDLDEEGDDYECYLIDKLGTCLLVVNDVESDMACNRATVIINDEMWLVDKTGKKICQIDADYIGEFGEEDEMATIKRDGKAAKIDKMGNIVLETQYSSLGEFVDGIARVWDDNSHVGYIDLQGDIVVNIEYDFGYNILKGSKVIGVEKRTDDGVLMFYFDLQGNLIWKDIPNNDTWVDLPWDGGGREGFVNFFDANMADLDPIEGIYYMTSKEFYQNRDNLNEIGLNSSSSDFFAITSCGDYFLLMLIDNPKKCWVNKFVRIGNSSTYAILERDKDAEQASEGRVMIDDFNKFEFKLDDGHNDWYNFFTTYEFIRDYPTIAEIEKFQQAEWTGSGFAIADGYIVTNYHVTNGAKTIRIKGVNGDMEEAYKGFVVASDKEHDLSIVKIVDKDFEGFDAIPYKIGKTTVDVGDDIFVLGYPMTQTMGEEVKLTNGVISAASGYKGDASMYQISAAVQSGNSGGPLFNEDGAVIGVVCAKHAGAENANYAVKVSYLYSLITSSNLGIDISGSDKVKGKNLSKQVKKIKDFVYLIECSSK